MQVFALMFAYYTVSSVIGVSFCVSRLSIFSPKFIVVVQS